MITGEDRLHDSGVDGRAAHRRCSGHGPAAPIVHRYADAALGEVRRPVATVPEISVLLEHEVEYARANTPFDRTFHVLVHSAATAPRDVDVSLQLPRGLRRTRATRRVSLKAAATRTSISA